jgi:predicted transcriptional regulator
MARKPRKPIPEAELEVLHALWDLGAGTVRDLLERFPGDDRAYTTVQTLLTRLEAKGYIASHKDGRALVYTPRLQRDDLLTEELADVASRVTGGRASPLVLNLVEHSDLTPDDLRDLRDLLDRLEAAPPRATKKPAAKRNKKHP